MSDTHILYIASDLVLELDGLKDEITGSYNNAAAVTVTLNDASGNPVAGDTWPKIMQYVSGSDGVYRAGLNHVLALNLNGRYTAIVTAVAGALHGLWTLDCLARLRR